MTFFWLIVTGILLIAALFGTRYFLARQKFPNCANCGTPSRFGYSEHAEASKKDITRFCLACLAAKLRDDYGQYNGRALVIEPAANLPCYVFQPKSKWTGSGILKDAEAMLSAMGGTCSRCDGESHFLWQTSKGLVGPNFEEVLSAGPSQTLLLWGNTRPVEVCAGCCVKLIVDAISSKNMSFLEVCSPRTEEGFVIPMAY
jgi:hypothetical protein